MTDLGGVVVFERCTRYIVNDIYAGNVHMRGIGEAREQPCRNKIRSSASIQQFRGLAARAPYFVNGSAADLRELVDFYDRRFNIRFTEQEKTDLVNFPGVL